jgi:hypothetical protein
VNWLLKADPGDSNDRLPASCADECELKLNDKRPGVSRSIQYSFNWQLTNYNCRQTNAHSKLNEVVTEKSKI